MVPYDRGVVELSVAAAVEASVMPVRGAILEVVVADALTDGSGEE